MPACARKEIVDQDDIGVYHCYSRCVRRGHLCGVDEYTGQDYSHRLDWFDQRIRQLQQVFLIDVFGYAFLDNHFHTILRNRPDLVAKLSDREVARRSLMLSTHTMPDTDMLAEPDPAQIERALRDRRRIKVWRDRLSDISSYMKYLKEVISRRANAEDEVTGCFWEGRFKSPRLLDSMAILLCSLYVDLNEIRAGIAETPERSTHSSIYQRIKHWGASRKGKPSGKRAWRKARRSRKESAPDFLSPIDERSDNGTKSGTMTEEQPRAKSMRPSDSGFLPLTAEQYFQLCDWFGRVSRPGKRGAIPKHLAPILERITHDVDILVATVKSFGKLFTRCAGSPEAIAEHRRNQGAQRVHGLARAREIYAA